MFLIQDFFLLKECTFFFLEKDYFDGWRLHLNEKKLLVMNVDLCISPAMIKYIKNTTDMIHI